MRALSYRAIKEFVTWAGQCMKMMSWSHVLQFVIVSSSASLCLATPTCESAQLWQFHYLITDGILCTDIPSHGDLQMLASDDNLVTIYMGPEGMDTLDENWGTLNGQGIQDKALVAKTLCRQMGYDNGTMWLYPAEPDLM